MSKFGFVLLLVGMFTTPTLAESVRASWYGPGFHGKLTASGEVFNQNEMTAAHKTFPFGTKIKVTHEGKTVIVTINDRGPFVKGRTLDLAEGAARKLGCIEKGVCMVDMKVID